MRLFFLGLLENLLLISYREVHDLVNFTIVPCFPLNPLPLWDIGKCTLPLLATAFISKSADLSTPIIGSLKVELQRPLILSTR
jgi:hypothetical protein